MVEHKKFLVVCIDRDDDLGRKAKILGPVIGRDSNLKSAAKLALTDPGETDANTMFAAVKKFDELKKDYPEIEVITLTGFGKSGFDADRVLNEQLDSIFEKFSTEGFILVTDGMEDDQVIPLLQSRAKIFSKETLIVKQAKAVESTFYTIMEALKDPYIARIVFGIPGIILLLYLFLGNLSLQLITLVFGIYLLLKGFGLEEKIMNAVKEITISFSTQRTSFPFYLGSFFIIAFGIITAYNKFSIVQAESTDVLTNTISATQSAYLFFFLAILFAVFGRAIDVIHVKKAYQLRKYLLFAISLPLIWLILESGTAVFLKTSDLNWFLTTIVFSFIIILISFQLSKAMDVRKKITKLLLGLPVYDSKGNWLGKVSNISREHQSLYFTEPKSKQEKELIKGNFTLKEGRIVAI